MRNEGEGQFSHLSLALFACRRTFSFSAFTSGGSDSSISLFESSDAAAACAAAAVDDDDVTDARLFLFGGCAPADAGSLTS